MASSSTLSAAPTAAGVDQFRRRLDVGLAWWGLISLMLDWHLGMIESEEGEPQPLGSIPLAQARPAISAALAVFERRAAFERWTVGRQEYALRLAICTRDEMPTPGTIRLTGYLPFLSLTGV